MHQASLNCSVALHSVTLEGTELWKNCLYDSQMRCIFHKGHATKAIESERHFFFEVVAFNNFTNSTIFMGLLIKNKRAMLTRWRIRQS